MLFMHNNRYLPLTGLLTYFVLPEKNCEIFEIFEKYFTKYFMKYFTPKNFMKFYITNYNTHGCCKQTTAFNVTLTSSKLGFRCPIQIGLYVAYWLLDWRGPEITEPGSFIIDLLIYWFIAQMPKLGCERALSNLSDNRILIGQEKRRKDMFTSWMKRQRAHAVTHLIQISSKFGYKLDIRHILAYQISFVCEVNKK